MDYIEFNNIKTNNLKGINFKLKKNSINCIIGPSGSGKSSLAFNTIYAVCDNEYRKMIGTDANEYKYDVESFGDLLISVSLKQLNYNTNPRSTIATYYGIDKFFKNIFASMNNVNPEIFSFNKYSSSCKVCKGLGYTYIPDESKIIDYDSSLDQIPFYPWKRTMKDYYKKLIEEVSKEFNIPLDIPFRDLDKKIKEILVYGNGNLKYKIKYLQGGRKRVKTSKYIGVFKQIENELIKGDNKTLSYTKKSICKSCEGTRFSSNVLKYKVLGYSIGDIYSMELSDLYHWIIELEKKLSTEYTNIKIQQSPKKFIENLISTNLEYLNLNRSISSLSGGEFQRLRLSQLLNSKFQDILFVLDEPLSSLHLNERKMMIKKIIKLKKKNTLIIVEHDVDVLKYCDEIVALGPQGGKNGGNYISYKEYIKRAYSEQKCEKVLGKGIYKIKLEEKINNVKPFEIDIPRKTCIGIGGVSGSGKTTFIKEILCKNIKNYKYISQKPIKGNVYSNVASYIEILDRIRILFAENNKVDKSIFSFHSSSEGSCNTCKGIGKIKFNDSNGDNLYYICPECNGKKYNHKVLEYKYYDYSIYDLLEFEIEDAMEFFKDKNKQIYITLKVAYDIGLGYLKLSQSIKSLSGGENQRIKLVKNLNLNKKDKVIALDEPFHGLNDEEIYSIMNLLYKFIKEGNTVIIAEHNLLALKLCSYIIEFGEGSGINGGNIIFSGKLEKIINSEKSKLKEYIL
ncbi:MAG: ATP-binding cassette domain-containing protein [Paraclostridium sordellii]